MDKNYIEGNVYAITGAGTGIGQGVAIAIAKMGGKVAIMGRRLDKLQGTVDAIKALGFGDNVVAFAGDVSKYEDNVAFVKKTVETFGKMDAFYANAGVMPMGNFEQHEACFAGWNAAIDINIKGNLNGICAAYDQFKAQGYGHFLTTSSVLGDYPAMGQAVYCATKIAVRYLAHALRVESPAFIKTTIINPASVPTTELSATGKSLTQFAPVRGGMFSDMAAAIKNQQMLMSGEHPEFADRESICNTAVALDDMVAGIIYTLNQPKGVNIPEITVGATNENTIY